MFSDCIRDKIHPATWAVVGMKKDLLGVRWGHRGTGFSIDAHGHVLTCWHVTFADDNCTEDLDGFEVLQPEINLTRRFRARLIAREKDRDLALLKIENEQIRTSGVTLNAGERIRWGTSCCAFGHPLSITSKQEIRIFTRAASGSLSTPMNSPRYEGCRIIRMYETDFFTHGGLSGGPLFLPNGCVFGVVSGSLMLDQDGGGKAVRSNLSIAIDVSEAIEFLQPLGIKPQLAGHVGGDVVPKEAKHGRSRKGRRKR